MLQPPIDPRRDHISGDKEAPVELVQYGDLQCSHCAKIFPSIKQLSAIMGDQLKIVFRHYPLPQIHSLALDAAIYCEMAALQGKFWEMHDIIFKNQQFLSNAVLLNFAKTIRMDIELFTSTANYKKTSRKVISDFESGVRSGVDITPTFFINGLRYSGTNDLSGLVAACKYASLSIPALHLAKMS